MRKGKTWEEVAPKALWGPSIPRLLLFKDELEKVESLSYEKEPHRYRSTGVCLRHLSSKDGFHFCVVSMT